MLKPVYKKLRHNGQYEREHVVIVEKAIGRRLKDDECVHHFNEDKRDNSPGNLIACNDQAYHALLHIRARAYNAVGNANARQCWVCSVWCIPGDEGVRQYKRKDRPNGIRTAHATCIRKRGQRRYERQIGRKPNTSIGRPRKDIGLD